MKIIERVRQKLRAWLGVHDVEPVQQRDGLSVANSLLLATGVRNIVHRKVQAPQLMPGVIPAKLPIDDPAQLGPYLALDSEAVAPSYAYANQFNCGMGFPGYAYLAELSQRSEYRAPSETIASEMTREFCKIVVKGKTGENGGEDVDGDGDVDAQDKVEKLTKAMEEFKVREMFCKIAELDGLFGRAQLYIDIDTRGRNQDEVDQLPLLIDPATIKQGSLKGFKVIEPIWTTPFTYNATDPRNPDFYVPKAWFLLGKRVHASRLLTFIMREVPDILKPAYNFGGLSMTQLIESYVFRWLRTANSVSDLIHNFSVMILKTDMTNVLSGKPDSPGGLLDRMKLFIQNRDNQGLMAINKDTEEMDSVNVPLGTLDKLQAQSQEHMAGPTHIPLVKLFGIVPTGLNANSEGEIKVFYDFVRACQQKFFGDHLNTILQILQLHLFGAIDDAIGFEWISLTAPTVKELAEIRKADADTAAVYVGMGAIAPEEVRERVASDPDSGYSNLTGDPPEPPTMVEMGAQHELSEESAEAAHKRQLEMQKNEPKPKAA